ncbi:hypothetical protein BBJ28_00023584 [Nothophytophthora sp. Chile5]|nr:hypothetical protein BBJ28_00023584 [Nothophytophthora sp. Chile5]
MEVTQSEDTLANQETAEPLAHEETAESLAHDDIVIPDVNPELETAAPPDEQHDAYDDGDYEVRDEAEVDATTSIEPSSDPIETAAPPDEQHDVCDDGDNEARDEEEVDAPAIVEPLFDPIETAEVGDEEQAYSHDFAQGTSQVDETATATDVLRSEENTEKPPASEGRDQSDQPIDGDPAVEATPSVAEEVEVVASPDVEEAQQKPPSDQHDPAEDEARSFTTPRIHSRPATPEEDAVATEQQITEEGRSGSPLLNEDHGGGSVPENTEAEHTQVLAPSTGSPDDSVDVSVEGNAAAASELPSEQADTGEEAPSSDLNAYDTYDYQHAQVDTRSGLPPPEPLALKDEVEETTVTAPSEESAVEASVEPAA